MRVIVAGEQRLLRWRDGYFTTAGDEAASWARYLDVFSSVCVVARAQEVSELPAGAERLDGAGITVRPLPDYRGPGSGLRNLPRLLAATRPVAAEDAAFILTVPGAVSTLLYRALRRRGWPYAVHVVGDPRESLSPRHLRRSWGWWARPLGAHWLARECRAAACANYVTREHLQRLYPAATPLTFHCSDVELPDELFEEGWQPTWEEASGELLAPLPQATSLVFVGSLAQRYKGLHVLLEALRLQASPGITAALTVVGDGSYRGDYERQARDLGLAGRVRFVGEVSREAVFEHLRGADLFVMPSLTEGLPRALLEAMACGLPCVGTRVGGIPELLPPEDLVPPGDPPALSRKLGEFLDDRGRRAVAAERNLRTARAYRHSALLVERLRFWRAIEEITFAHMTAGR